MKKNIYTIILLVLTVSILGCAAMPVCMDRAGAAKNIAGKAGFTKEHIKAGDFTLMTCQRFNKRSDNVSVYIEGDGRAWETKYRLSGDPTPSNPVALKLAAVDPADNIAYIARPGQYPPSGFPECDARYWSGFRFAPEVIYSFNRAIDILKEKSMAKHVELVGYSGGGAIAVLVAAQRSDVVALRTVAGNLDTNAFCTLHHVSQLDASLNPLDFAVKVAHIPQRHFVGRRDKVIPLAIAQSFVTMEKDKDYARITIVDSLSHNDGWHKRWKELLLMPLKLRDASGVLALLRSPEAELGRASKCAVEPRKPKP
jgi:hypothetical protein